MKKKSFYIIIILAIGFIFTFSSYCLLFFLESKMITQGFENFYSSGASEFTPSIETTFISIFRITIFPQIIYLFWIILYTLIIILFLRNKKIQKSKKILLIILFIIIPILLYYPYAFIVFKINLYFNYKLPKGITHEIKIDLANDSPVVNDVFNYDFPGNYSLVGKSEDDISIIPDNLNYTNDVPYIPSKVLKFRYSLNGEIIVAERLSPENDTIDYWILDSTIPIVYGEMSKEEYEEKLKEYSATEEFELMDVAPFKETYVYP